MKLAILDDYQFISPAYFEPLRPRLAQISYYPDTLNPSDPTQHEALIARLQPYDIVMTMRERTPFSESTLSRLPNLKLLLTTGTRNLALDVAYAASRGIPVAGTPASASTVGVSSTVQHTWALILSLARGVARDDAAIKRGEWQGSELGMSLEGKTLGVLGLGRLGTGVARIAALAFGMPVLAWSTNLTQERADEVVSEAGMERGSIRVAGSKAEFFAAADVVTLHSVLSERSRGIVGWEELKVMKKSALLVNTSRGPLVDQDALLATLKSGGIRGAALDVFETEPLPKESPWRATRWGEYGRSQVLLTPHTGYLDEQIHDWYKAAAENLEKWLDGKELSIRLN